MKTFKQLLETIDNDIRIKDEGLYSAVDLHPESHKLLNDFTIRNFGKDLPKDVHCTVMYSTKSIDNNIAKQFSKNLYNGYAKKFEYWDGHDNAGYLVLKLESDDLSSEHKRLKENGCKPTFDSYSPHITIQTPIEKQKAQKMVDIGNNDLDNKGLPLKFHNQKLDTLKL